MSQPWLAELQATIDREIPMCPQMGIRVQAFGEEGLSMGMPLARNHNHQRTGFAGSLNALCTVAGWGSVFLLIRRHGLRGDIVIRRSAIRYLKPVSLPQIIARCLPVGSEEEQHFVEMLADKGQAKLDVTVEITDGECTAVSFHGSYVVLDGNVAAAE